MRKTDRKVDNKIREALTVVCEIALQELPGFQWLTHLVNYPTFPKSLKVVCVFDTNENLNNFTKADGHHGFSVLIQRKLFEIGIDINNSHISYDTEENCHRNNNGNWTKRLAR